MAAGDVDIFAALAGEPEARQTLQTYLRTVPQGMIG
jgi:hypothetical protein